MQTIRGLENHDLYFKEDEPFVYQFCPLGADVTLVSSVCGGLSQPLIGLLSVTGWFVLALHTFHRRWVIHAALTI